MDAPVDSADLFLVCRIKSRLCALPIARVKETMRPLPVQPLAPAPGFLRGVAIIRGEPVPVLDIPWIATTGDFPPTRFVTIDAAGRSVALPVDSVVGVRAIPNSSLMNLPPLMQDVTTGAIAAIGTLDAELLLLLQSARVVPEDVWKLLEPAGAVR